MKKWKNSENVIQENKAHEIPRYVGRMNKNYCQHNTHK